MNPLTGQTLDNLEAVKVNFILRKKEGIQSMRRLIPLSILLSFHALVLTGCVSQIASVKDAGQAYIGHSIKELEEAMARPGAYPPVRKWIAVTQLPDGKSLYIGAVREDCNIHWTVNQEGTIESFKTEGERCY